MAEVVAQQSTELSCVVIPLSGMQLLLPNICIAEILPWRRVKVLEDAPDWCLGILGWRGESIPVIRFERFSSSLHEDRKVGRCMIVMNRSRTADAIPFYALAAEGLPRMLQLTDGDLENVPAKLGKAEVATVRVGTESAIIPDLKVIEQHVSELANARKRA
ncbi:MAG: chemotaxis protein CheW, partial [Pseudomonadales bacterium]